MTVSPADRPPRAGHQPHNDAESSPVSGVVAVAAAAVRAAAAAIAGLILTGGLALLFWAITPSSGAGPAGVLRAGVVAFAGAHGMSIKIGAEALTVPPTMLAVLAAAMLAATVSRGRMMPRGRGFELAAVVAAGLVYGAVITMAARLWGPAGMVPSGQWWRPALLAAGVTAIATGFRGDGWASWIRNRLPRWLSPAFGLSAIGVLTMLGGGALAVATGLVGSFSAANKIGNLAAPGINNGVGMVMLGLAFLPNAVVAGAGYLSGVGFTIGGGSYSPLGSTTVDLPAIPLLAAAPANHGVSVVGAVFLLVPVVAAVLIGRGAASQLGLRRDRVLAAVAAGVLAGVALAVLAQLVSGGISGGPWTTIGVPAAAFGVVVALELAVIAGATAAVAGGALVSQEASEPEEALLPAESLKVSPKETPKAPAKRSVASAEQEIPAGDMTDQGEEPGDAEDEGMPDESGTEVADPEVSDEESDEESDDKSDDNDESGDYEPNDAPADGLAERPNDESAEMPAERPNVEPAEVPAGNPGKEPDTDSSDDSEPDGDEPDAEDSPDEQTENSADEVADKSPVAPARAPSRRTRTRRVRRP